MLNVSKCIMPKPCSQTQREHPSFFKANIRDTIVCQLIKTCYSKVQLNWLWLHNTAICPTSSSFSVPLDVRFNCRWAFIISGRVFLFYTTDHTKHVVVLSKILFGLHILQVDQLYQLFKLKKLPGQRISNICIRSRSSSSSFKIWV